MKLRIVGGLLVFVAFGLWLANKAVYVGPITHRCPSPDRCVKSERFRVPNGYVWRCTDYRPTPTTGNLTFTFTDLTSFKPQRHYWFDLPGDTLDKWGVKYDHVANVIEAKRLDVELVP